MVELAPAGLAPVLIVITDRAVADAALTERRIERTLALARPGSVLVQLRDKQESARYRLSLGLALREICRASGQYFAVNDRLDLAVLLAADAVHLGEDGVDTDAARRVVPGSTWVSRACHDLGQVAQMDADALLLSPIVSARKGKEPLEFAALGVARTRLDEGTAERPGPRRRLYALGGVDASNAARCLLAGADGVAVVGAVLASDEPSALVAALGIAKRG